MDIRKWLNGPKGLKSEPKPAEIVSKKKKKRFTIDSSDEEEEIPKKSKNLQNEKPKPKLRQSDVVNRQEINPASFFSPGKPTTTPKKSDKKPEKKNPEKNSNETEKRESKKRKGSDAQEAPKKKSKIESTYFETEQENNESEKSPKKSPKKTSKKQPTEKKSQNGTTSPQKSIQDEPMNDTRTDDAPKTDEAPKTVEAPKTPAEKKKFNYYKYKAKLDSGPKNPGSKPVPEGAENCLEGITFVLTGTGDSMGRDETKALVERYGGKVTSAVSGKTGFLVVGDDPGESKITKAKEKKVKMINEDELFELIKTKPGKKSKYEIAAEQEAKEDAKKLKKEAKTKKEAKNTPKKQPKNPPKEETKIKREPDVVQKSPEVSRKKQNKPEIQQNKPEVSRPAKVEPMDVRKSESKESVGSLREKVSNVSLENSGNTPTATPPELWVEKYKPKNLAKIVGQTGAASCAKKLFNWLRDWEKNQGVPKEQRPKPKWSGTKLDDPSGASMRAALLSGPPGVGKTTSALMVARECGMDVIEFNASDTRSKKSLGSIVRDAAGQYSIANSMKDQNTQKGKKVLVMDEVDGMAGNEDRGGMAELIQIIKNSKIPIICLCNDRQHQKIRSLAGHCFDLRFQKPRVEQITGAMMSICYKEGFQIAAPAVQNIIRACNQDIRQTINTLSMMASNNINTKKLEYDDVKKTATECKKDTKLGVFDVARLIFQDSKSDVKVTDKMNYFFEDYSLIPKFNFENYPQVRPLKHSNKRDHMRALAESASSFSYSNIAESKIMKNQAWQLLNTQAVFSAVIPCNKLAGSMSGMINFPSELGKISTTNKNARLADVLKFHTSLKSKSDRKGIVSMLGPTYRENLTRPLVDQSKGKNPNGVDQVIDFLDHYDLTKEDMDNILELTNWPHVPDPLKQVDSKTKAALTRTYNKLNLKRSYATQGKEKAKKKAKASMDDDEENSDAQESDDDITAFQKKSKAAKSKKVQKPKKK